MKLRALVVDDSRVMRHMVMESLRQTGLADFEFAEAEDGTDALEKFNPKKTDIIFADWNMPNMSGIEFVRNLRRSNSNAHVPVIMVTTENTVGKIEEALDKAGANGYIIKPFTVEYLQRKLTHVIECVAERQRKASGGFFSKLVGGST